MKRKPKWLIIFGIPLLILAAIYGRCPIVPNTAIGQDNMRGITKINGKPLTFTVKQDKKLKFPKRKTVFDPPGLSQEEADYMRWRMLRKHSTQDSFYTPIFIEVALDLYREYSAECYADSFAMSGEVYRDWETAKLDTIYPASRPGTYLVGTTGDIVKTWFHKQPTFPGFMAWLEEKYEVEK